MKNPAAAWIYRTTNPSRLNIYLDTKIVNEIVPFQLRSRLICELVLHEIGHLLPNQKVLTQARATQEARPVDEADAWWFCYSIFGLCVGQCACEKKADPVQSGLPPIWELILMQD